MTRMSAGLDASPSLGRSCGVSPELSSTLDLPAVTTERRLADQIGYAARLIAVAAAAAAAAIVYVPVLTRLATQWIADEDAAYGVIVAGAAAVLFWQRRSRVRVLPRCGSNAAVVILAGGCLIHVIGTLAADVFLVRVSLPVVAVATAWFVAGQRYVRALAAPFALCFVAIPLPSALVTEVTMPLQLMASQVAAALLAGVGVPVVRDGNVLTLSHITLAIAEACSGMRSLVTLSALVAVYAAMRELPVRRIVVLAAITVPVALVGNGVRVAFTAVLAQYFGAAATRGAVHDATGWLAFVLMALAIYRAESLLNRFTHRSQPDPRR
jgi:exosortase